MSGPARRLRTKVAKEGGGHGPGTRQHALGKPVGNRMGSRPQRLPFQPDEGMCCPCTIEPPPSLCSPFLLKASPSRQLSRFLMTRPVSYQSLRFYLPDGPCHRQSGASITPPLTRSRREGGHTGSHAGLSVNFSSTKDRPCNLEKVPEAL